MKWIYDRTEEDVARVKELTEKYLSGTITESEKAEWHGDMKGALNLSDLNRVEGNLSVIAELLSLSITTKTWSIGTIPRESDYQRICDNLQTLRNAIPEVNTPEVPNPPLNTYQKWNDIERIIFDIYDSLMDYDYAGSEIYAGEGVGIL